MSAKALVVGGLGVTGSYILNELKGRPGWELLGLARKNPDNDFGIPFLALDLLDREACEAKLGELRGITHLFYTARNDQGDLSQQATVNLAMLRNVLEPIDTRHNALQHVHLMHGMKAYGNMLGPFKTPAQETDPRLPLPLTYYVQEDYVRSVQPASAWTWSSLRPGGVAGITFGRSGNIVSILGFYGSICRELGWPLWFPGSAAGFDALRQICDARLLARAAVWVATEASCANQSFNVHNGDVFRWRHLWPDIARFFEIEPAGPINLRLPDLMKDKNPIWEAITQRHQLVPCTLSGAVSWDYSQVFHNGWDAFANANRLYQSGFHETVDTRDALLACLQQLRSGRFIP